MLKYFILIMLFISINGTAFSEKSGDMDFKDKEYTNKLSIQIANCGGVYLSMSIVLKNVDKEHASKTYEDTARGSSISAAYLVYISQNIPKWENAVIWADNLKETSKNYWMGTIELFPPTKTKIFPDDFTKELNSCLSLMSTQTLLVDMVRKEIYSKK